MSTEVVVLSYVAYRNLDFRQHIELNLIESQRPVHRYRYFRKKEEIRQDKLPSLTLMGAGHEGI